jgi:predicted RNase H-like nuclease
VLADLVTAAESDGGVDMVAIDIPIGLPDNSFRRAALSHS